MYTYIGERRVIGKNDMWGGVGSWRHPSSAAKIASSIHTSGIGEANPRIQLDPQNTIYGGPGKVHFYAPDDQFLEAHLPRKYPMLLRG